MPEKKWMSKKVYNYDNPRLKEEDFGNYADDYKEENLYVVKRIPYEIPTVNEEATRIALEEYPTKDQKDTFKAEVAKYPKYSDFKAVDSEGNKLKKADANLISKFAEEMQVIQHDLKNRILNAVLGDALDPKIFYEKLWGYPQHKDLRVPVVFQFEKSKTTGKEGTAHTFKWDEVADAVYKKKGIVICPAIHFYKYKKTKTLMRSVSLKSNHIMEIPALCIDVDDVFAQDLGRWLDQGWNFKSRGGDFEAFPDPNIIVNSGNGLHLYYLLDKPVSYHHNIENLEKLYATMQYKYKTVKQNKADYIKAGFIGNKMQSLLPLSQSFRAPGSVVKAFKKEPEHFRLVKAFEFREDKYSINELSRAFGLDDLEFIDGIDKEKFPDFVKYEPYVKHLEGKALSKAEYRVKCLVEEISKKSVDLGNDLIIFARACKSAEISFEELEVYLEEIINEYEKRADAFDLEEYQEKIKNAYESTASGVYVKAKYSFKESIKGSMQSSYFYSKCKEIKNHIHVGNRYWTLVAMADIANKCNVSKESYVAEMKKYYLEIQDAVEGRGDDPFTEKDFDAGVSRYDLGYVKTSKRKLEEWVGFSLDGQGLPKGEYVKKESKEIYHIIAMARFIDSYIRSRVWDEDALNENLEIIFPSKQDLLGKYKDMPMKVPYIDKNTNKQEEILQTCNESFVYRYYDLVLNYIINNSADGAMKLPVYAYDLDLEECLSSVESLRDGLNFVCVETGAHRLKNNPDGILAKPPKIKGKKEFEVIMTTADSVIIKILFKKTKEEEVECYFKNNPDHSVNQASKELGMSRPTVTKYVKKLKEEGRI